MLTWTAAARRAARWPRMPVTSPSGSSSESDAAPGGPLCFFLRFNAGSELKIAKISLVCAQEKAKNILGKEGKHCFYPFIAGIRREEFQTNIIKPLEVEVAVLWAPRFKAA